MSLHSHIQSFDSIVGLESQKRALKLLSNMIQQGHQTYTSLLLAGPMSSGKTALAVAFSKTLPANTFTQINASTLTSAQINEAEALTVAVRRSIILKIAEKKIIFTGVVTKINCQTFENGVKIAVVQRVNITLQTKKQTLEIKLDGKLYNSLQQQNIQINDVIWIDTNASFVKRLGRSTTSTTSEKSLISDVMCPMPDGYVSQEKNVVQYVSLNELDQANAQVGTPGLNLESFYTNLPTVATPTQKLRDEIDKIIINKIENGTCEVLPGVLFIDEASSLSIEACSYLNSIQEARFHPFIIYASNRGISQVNNSEQYSLYGLPNDLLDRCLIVVCQKQEDPATLQKILELRSQVEQVKIQEDAMKELVSLAQISLRYAEELISVCDILRKTKKGEQIQAEDVQEASKLFKMSNN